MSWARITAYCALFFALGCTQGKPTISATENLPAIILNENFFQSKNLELFDISLKGRVSKFVSNLEVSFDNGNSWLPLENGAQSSLQINLATCTTNCEFSYVVNNVGQKWSMLMQLPFEAEAQGLIRGSSLYGYTEPTFFRIKRLKRGFVSVGAIGLNRVGAKSANLPVSKLKVLGGKLEAQKVNPLPVASGSVGVNLKSQGVVQ